MSGDAPSVVGALVDPAIEITRVRICSVIRNGSAMMLRLEFKATEFGPIHQLTFETPEEFEKFGDELFATAQLAWPGRFNG